MNKSLFLLTLGVILSLQSLAQKTPVDYVNPFIGTDIRQHAKEWWGNGQTYPGAVVPWGMVSVSPTTDIHSPSGYIHSSEWLYGFGHVHLSGTGCPDLGSVLLMPTLDSVKPALSAHRSHYSQEKATPGYYKTTLQPSGIEAEMTATTRSGISRYHFPAGKEGHNILLDASFTLSGDMMPALGYVKINSKTQIEGWTRSGSFCIGGKNPRQTQKVYFVAQFSQPADSMGTWKGENIRKGLEQSGKQVGAFFRYKGDKAQMVEVKVGVSYVSIANALENLESEQPHWDFEKVKMQARKSWNDQLSRIEVSGGPESQKTIFYTALYHMLLQPNVFSDVNGEYMVMEHDGVRKAKDYTHYTVFSLWDTYRNEHPFLTLFYPSRQEDMVKSMLAMYQENGWLPKWELAGRETYVMTGDPAVPVIANTWLNGLQTFDKNLAWEAMRHEAMDTSKTNPIRPGLAEYVKKHFISIQTEGVWGALSTTLEYNFADYSLARFAQSTGHPEEAKTLKERSLYYKNFWDDSTQFLRPKNSDRSWVSPFDPTTDKVNTYGFVEGNAWNYLFFVPHDPKGLAKVLGGEDIFIKRLQESIDKGYFVMWNEPDMAYPYLFTYFDKAAWHTQKAVRETMANVFSDDAGGLPGNDDCGVTSAWYVFSALGFYPANPASGNYRLGSPIFDKVTIHLDQDYYKGKTFTIEAHHASDQNIYVQSMKLNGKPYPKHFITYQDIENGGTLEFTMDANPDKKH